MKRSESEGVVDLTLARQRSGECPLRVIFCRDALSQLTAAFPQIAAVARGCLRRQSWAKMSHATHFIGTAELHQKADAPGQRSALASRAITDQARCRKSIMWD